jgi:purine nucleosidase
MARIRKVIIDTDPGVDDALAVFFALASPEIEVIGVTSVFGNAAIDVTTRNALALVEIAGRPDIPVAQGAAKPLAGPYLGPVPQIHGKDGQGDGGVPEPTRKVLPISAAEFIRRTVEENPREVTIAAIGPLTNLALALQLRPEIAGQVEQVVIMGGNALVPGNATPHAEANIFNDAEAADLVFAADWPVVMVGLDVTHRALLTDAAAVRITSSSKPTSRHIAKALPLYRKFFEDAHQLHGVYLHDPSALAYLVDGSLFKVQQWPIRVETKGGTRGKTMPWTGEANDSAAKAWDGRRRMEVCVDVDAPRLIELVVQRLS